MPRRGYKTHGAAGEATQKLAGMAMRVFPKFAGAGLFPGKRWFGRKQQV